VKIYISRRRHDTSHEIRKEKCDISDTSFLLSVFDVLAAL